MNAEKSRLAVSPGAALFFPILYFLDTEAWFSALLPSVLLHEAGHYLMIKTFGGSVRSMSLDMTGLCMETASMPDIVSEILCLLAGPCVGLLWIPAARLIGGEWGQRSAAAAVAINLFNLLPVLPLDGGRVVMAITGKQGLLKAFGLIIPGIMIAAAICKRLPGLLIPSLLLLKKTFSS